MTVTQVRELLIPPEEVETELREHSEQLERMDRSAAALLSRLHEQREASKGCIMLSNEWRVTPSNELVQRLRSEYGRRNVVVDY